MKISRTVTYAVQAALQLAQSDSRQPVPCSRLAAQGQMPERFLLQILRNMVTHGILHSTRGVEGGYSLDRPSSEVSLLDIVEAVEGPFTASPVEGGSDALQGRLNEALDDINACVASKLAAVKLADLLPSAENVRYGPERFSTN
jgi:Rrf2 family transcriptional regulator, cysteine metabolism repressor